MKITPSAPRGAEMVATIILSDKDDSDGYFYLGTFKS